ncbi:GAF domain-containing protein [Agromyces seonyuensis]|nr:GAF domain-containing protein [Agromyces seonyuensis]
MPERTSAPQPGGLRDLVASSWLRARAARLEPELAAAPLDLDADALDDLRAAHPLAAALPVVRRLLVQDAEPGSGVLVAVGDARGRLLWVEGDPGLRAKAEGMRFVEGADWSEATVGTSAPGTALAVDRGVQIRADEHFAETVKPWSCTAVPVHDPEHGELIGVLDVTGGSDAAAAHVLPLLVATAAAVERELLIERLRRPARSRPKPTRRTGAARLSILGRDTGELVGATGERTTLSARHSELLALLAWHRGGIGAEALAALVYGDAPSTVTLRAEIVRLRRALAGVAPELGPLARPYRLGAELELDLGGVVELQRRGAHRAAVEAFGGGPLPGSASPGVAELHADVAAGLREALLESGSADLLLAWGRDRGRDDAEVWRAALHALPRLSPKRAIAVAALERIERELG